MGRHAFIIGASGQIGRATGERLLRAGWTVTCTQRSDALPELLELGAMSARVDRDDQAVLRAAVADGADAVIDTIAFDETHARQLLELQDIVGQFSVISSASVYSDDRGRTLDEARSFETFPQFPIPISETQPTTAPGPQTYSTKKIVLENALLEHCRVPVNIIRPCAIYGPNSKHPREWWFVKRYLDGRSRVPLSSPGNIFHTSATPNIAAVIEAALNLRFHGPLNAGDPFTPNVYEIGATIARGLNWDCEFIRVPKEVEGIGDRATRQSQEVTTRHRQHVARIDGPLLGRRYRRASDRVAFGY